MSNVMIACARIDAIISSDDKMAKMQSSRTLACRTAAYKCICIKSFTDDEFVTRMWTILVLASEEVKISLDKGYRAKVSIRSDVVPFALQFLQIPTSAVHFPKEHAAASYR